MNSDVKFGARKDTRDVETLSKSSGVNLSVRIKSEALDRAKQGVDSVNQIKSGDILGGLASTTNTVTGIVSGLASNQGTKLPTSAINKNNSNSNDDDDDDDKNNQTNTVGKNGKKTAISTKSLDLTSKSYTSKEYKNQMYYIIKGYIDDINNFKKAGKGEDVLTKQR